MQVEKIPLRGQLLYAAGTMGWSIVVNLLAGIIIYFYQPVGDAELNNLIPKITILGFINALTLVVLSARLIDAVIDPFIAHQSDKSEHKREKNSIYGICTFTNSYNRYIIIYAVKQNRKF